MKRQIVIGITELKNMELTCPNQSCGAKVILDVTNPSHELPTQCLKCATDWRVIRGSGLDPEPPLALFRKFLGALSEKYQASFCMDEHKA